ncbi:phospholipase D family protein [Pseudoruegeria sp. HB172150]|uniref:phospholipase D family protein n=1 Tax=Pseudoruegeria sp. HB172150 TaxID=2721164 RepID=UPI001556FC2D|nr:phospholipase D family protein [Pseudoruegeria sp. HB172150]
MKDMAQAKASAPEVLITAEEAYPVFERRVLAAREQIVMGFRIFDPTTRLHSEEAKAVGDTWADLLLDALERGVRIEIHLSDFDPVAATDLHEICWRSVRVLCGVREIAGPAGKNLTVHPEIHPAKTGAVARVFFWPFVAAKMRQLVRRIEQDNPASHRRRVLKYIPGFAYLHDRYKGRPVFSFPASHHQKLASFDDRWLYIGGLDLNERRWDRKDHDRPAQETWHDVQVLVDDPEAATSARRHLECYNATAAGHHEVIDTPGILRTLSQDQSHRRPWSMAPRTIVHELADIHHEGIRKAKRLIYLETQFFRDRKLASALARRARENPDLHLILILPAAPETVAFFKNPKLDGRYGDFLQSRCLRKIRRAFHGRLLIASPVQQRRTNGVDVDADRASLADAPIIYVHAKVSIFDDELGIISSANLNGRSLRWDTEAGVAFREPENVMRLREQVIRHWLPDDPEALTPESGFAHWRKIVRENNTLPPEDRHGYLVPYDRKAAEATALPLPGMPEEMV